MNIRFGVYSFLTLIILLGCEPEKTDFIRFETEPVSIREDSTIVFNGFVRSLNNQKIIDHGFIFNENKISLGPLKKNGLFSTDLILPTKSNMNIEVAAFLETEKKIIIGNYVTFKTIKEIKAEIINVTPSVVNSGDTITISGKGFRSILNSYNLFIGETKSKVLLATDSFIKAIVPKISNSQTEKIVLKIDDILCRGDFYVKYFIPKVSLTPGIKINYLDTLTINFDYLPKNAQISVKIENELISLLSVYTDSILFIIPPIQLKNGEIEIFYFGIPIHKSTLSITETTITHIDKSDVFIGDTIILIGQGIIPNHNFSRLTIENSLIEFQKLTRDTIIIIIPDIAYPTEFPEISAQIGDFHQKFKIKILNKWRKIIETPSRISFSNRIIENMVHNDEGYFYNSAYNSINLLNIYTKSFFTFDSESEKFKEHIFNSKNTLFAHKIFTIKNKSYALIQINGDKGQIMSYDITNKTWAFESVYPGPLYNHEFSKLAWFSTSTKGYIGKGIYDDFWEYDSLTKKWNKKKIHPAILTLNGDTKITFTHNGIGYMGVGYHLGKSYIWKFDSINDSWSIASQCPFTFSSAEFVNSNFIDGEIFTVNTNTKRIFIYNIEKDTWKTGVVPFNVSSNCCVFSNDVNLYFWDGNYIWKIKKQDFEKK